MNKIITGIFILLLAGSFTGCGLIRHGHHNKSATDSTTTKPDSIITLKADTAKNGIKSADTATAMKSGADTSLLHKADTVVTVQISPEKKQLIDNISFLWQRPFDFTTFDGKAKMSYGNKDFTANFRMKKDSVIWVAVTGSAFGITIQVARVYITPDTFKMVNYLGKEVTIMSMAEAAKLLPTPMDYSSLQNFILGQPLRRSGTITDAKDSTGSWLIQVMDNIYRQNVGYSKADSNMQVINMNTINPKGPKAVTHYTNYTLVDGREFSRNRNMSIDNEGKHYSIEMNFVNQEFDKPEDMPFSLPSNYSINR